MRTILFLFGVPDMPTTHFIVFIGLVIGCALVLGWIADTVMGDDGFGVILNTIIAFIGAIGGVWAWRYFGLTVKLNPHLTTAIVASSSALVMLIGSALTRRLI